MSLKNQNAVVFGGSNGIGLAICQSLLKEGVQKLYILDVQDLAESSRVLLEGCNGEAKVLFKHCDIANRALLLEILKDDVFQTLGTIDILVNSAGIATVGLPDKTINVNLIGLINSSLFCLDQMSRAKGGKGGVIVNVASVAGLEPIPFIPIYSASKHGVVGFTRSLGVPQIYDRTGVKFIAICPGATKTKLFESQRSRQVLVEIDFLQEMFDDYVQRFKAQSPDVVGQCVVQAIAEGENGSAWICNEGVIMPHVFSESQFL
ncbi:alcohol dehydrogenase 1-like [Anopheles bellator]|uniref:alcohol dehydrogenase 1-like n=1 Tax=Anopheles bellator TaxID=139047 RepID=UPI002648A7B5|nr:alcohol dehydrogenase 1-like [Anopheles bellator]